jgi:hypothetical protein
MHVLGDKTEARKQVVHAWSQVASALEYGGQSGLAADVRRFVAGMTPPRTDRESVAEVLVKNAKSRSREHTALR